MQPKDVVRGINQADLKIAKMLVQRWATPAFQVKRVIFQYAEARKQSFLILDAKTQNFLVSYFSFYLLAQKVKTGQV